MQKLKQLQSQLADLLLDKADDIFCLNDLPKINVDLQRNIYQQSYTGSILNAVENICESSRKLMGEAFMRGLIKHFIENNPCQEEDFTEYAKKLAEYVNGIPTLAKYPYLGDMILLDCAWDDAYHGIDATQIEVEELKSLTESEYQKLIFTLQPNGTLLYSVHPLLQLWTILQKDDTTSYYELKEEGVCLFIWREEMQIHLDKLTEVEASVLLEIKKQVTLVDLFERIELPEAVIMNQIISSVSKKWIGGYYLID